MNLTLLILALVPWFGGQGYTRLEPDVPWYVSNYGTPSQLFLNGVYQSSESGTNDMALFSLWTRHSGGVSVGVVDLSEHGDRVWACVQAASPNSLVLRYPLSRWYPDVVAAGIINLVNAGSKVVTLANGYPTPDASLRNAIEYARDRDVVVVAALPNTDADFDTTTADYPYRWKFSNVLPVYGTDRNGQMYFSITAASGVGAPCRNIVAAGTYATGNSYACGLAAGAIAVVWHAHPKWSAATLVAAVQDTADQIVGGRRINAVAALEHSPRGWSKHETPHSTIIAR